MDELQVNDGHGLYDNYGLIDTLIVDCNNLPKALIDNQFVLFGNTLVQMVQKLQNLKQGIKADQDSMAKQIAELRKQNDELEKKVYGTQAERTNINA